MKKWSVYMIKKNNKSLSEWAQRHSNGKSILINTFDTHEESKQVVERITVLSNKVKPGRGEWFVWEESNRDLFNCKPFIYDGVHLVNTQDDDKLIEFCSAMGMKKEWFQDHNFKHFDCFGIFKEIFSSIFGLTSTREMISKYRYYEKIYKLKCSVCGEKLDHLNGWGCDVCDNYICDDCSSTGFGVDGDEIRKIRICDECYEEHLDKHR